MPCCWLSSIYTFHCLFKVLFVFHRSHAEIRLLDGRNQMKILNVRISPGDGVPAHVAEEEWHSLANMIEILVW